MLIRQNELFLEVILLLATGLIVQHVLTSDIKALQSYA